MRKSILAIMGAIMLIGFITIGFFVFPIGISLCGILGLCYGIKKKDKLFVKWSLVALSIGIVADIYTLFLVYSM